MGHDGRGVQNNHKYARRQAVFPTFRNALAQDKLETLATFLSVNNQIDKHIRRQIQNTLTFIYYFPYFHRKRIMFDM